MRMLSNAPAWSATADTWSKMGREYISINGFFIDDEWILRRVSFGIKRLEVSLPSMTEDASIKTAERQAHAIKVW